MTNPIETKIDAGLSSILYHYTTLKNAVSILVQKEFRLEKMENTEALEFVSTKDDKPFYFLSTSRSKTGGYHANQISGVIFVLDGIALGHNYKGQSVDFFHQYPKERPTDHRQQDEMEDRILSHKAVIPNANKYIKEIHLPLGSVSTRGFLENKMEYHATHLKIPLYLYENEQDWLNLNKKKAIDKMGKLAAMFKSQVESKYTVSLWLGNS